LHIEAWHHPLAKEAHMDRKRRLLSLFDATGVGLEIGPSFNPLLPKRDGYNVETLDHLSAADLREKYKSAPDVDLSAIEEIDYLSDGGSILELIGKPAHYDYIVASHVIEHTTDLLGFLSDCEQLLKDTGILVLAVPDKRFSFDCLRPCSTAGQVLQGHLEQRKRHAPGQVFDEIAYNCLRAGAGAWKRNDAGALAFFRPLSDAHDAFEELRHRDRFHDIHAWQFTPSSFRLIMSDLAAIGATGLREKSFEDTIEYEFLVSLSKAGSGCPVDRLALARQAVSEQNAIRVDEVKSRWRK
jgi:SAM-dependent methyltransferase